MKKIITLFQRNYDTDKLVRDEVTPGAEWVIAGEGVATCKFDGSCCLIQGGRFFKRYELRHQAVPDGGWKPMSQPAEFTPVTDIDPVTGKQQGWVPVGDGPEDRWHREAMTHHGSLPDGTYELCGPKVQGNPEGLDAHILIPHGKSILCDCPRDFAGLKAFLETAGIEGVVFHHQDGRMVKIKRRDFFRK